MKKLSPILITEEIEPCLPFWRDRLGFEVTVTVPHGEKTGFAILQKGGLEVMYQTFASCEDDIPGVAPAPGGSVLFIEVESVDRVQEALGDAPVVVPRRRTFYGMDEIFVRAPCGTVVGFAAPVEGERPGE